MLVLAISLAGYFMELKLDLAFPLALLFGFYFNESVDLVFRFGIRLLSVCFFFTFIFLDQWKNSFSWCEFMELNSLGTLDFDSTFWISIGHSGRSIWHSALWISNLHS